MKTFNHPLLAIALLASFIALAHYSLLQRDSNNGYTPSQISAVNALVASNGDYKASAIMSLFHIEAREVSQPILLFGEGVQ
jgi:hypothetical protein